MNFEDGRLSEFLEKYKAKKISNSNLEVNYFLTKEFYSLIETLRCDQKYFLPSQFDMA